MWAAEPFGDDGIVIDLSGMRSVYVDSARRRTRRPRSTLNPKKSSTRLLAQICLVCERLSRSTIRPTSSGSITTSNRRRLAQRRPSQREVRDD